MAFTINHLSVNNISYLAPYSRSIYTALVWAFPIARMAANNLSDLGSYPFTITTAITMAPFYYLADIVYPVLLGRLLQDYILRPSPGLPHPPHNSQKASLTWTRTP
jgi:hypothetical protein